MVTRRRAGILLLLTSLISMATVTLPVFNQSQPRPPITPPPTTQPSQQPTRAPQATSADECQGENLLLNPSFEGQYSAYLPPGGHPDCPSGLCQTAQMAHGWTPYWRSHDPADKDWIIRMPEYKPAELTAVPPRVRSGERGQAYFTFWSTHEAGFYQRVPAIPGALYCFSLWGHSWSQTEDDPYTSNQVLEQRLGIDPTGGINWQSADIFWGPLQHQPDAFGLFSIAAVAESNFITVYTYSLPDYPAKHNDVYWDDARLTVSIDGGSLDVPDSLGYLADVDEPGLQQQTIAIDLSGAPGLTWSASVSAGTLPVEAVALSPESGSAGEEPTVTVDTTGLSTGTYTTTVIINANIGLPGSPASVPIQVLVVPEVREAYSPVIIR